MTAGGSKLAVYPALGANSVVAGPPSAAFAITRSGSRLSERVCSIASVGIQALRSLGVRRAQTQADSALTLGSGREAVAWSLVGALGVFFLGCGGFITHGIQALLSRDHPGDGSPRDIGLPFFALGIEGASAPLADRALDRDARATLSWNSSGSTGGT